MKPLAKAPEAGLTPIMRARIYLGTAFSLVFGTAAASFIGCAESDTINTGGFNQTSSSGTAGAGGESGAGGNGSGGQSGSSSSSSSSSASSSSGMGGAGGGSGSGGAGGGGGAGGDMSSSSSSSSSSGMVDPCMGGCPMNTYNIDGNPLTGQCGCEYACTPTGAADPIDDMYKDDNCDGADGVVESCIYVSAGIGNDVNNGTRNDPMKTISGAIQRAQMLGVPAVCLSGEIYNETVNVASGISVYGGFDHNDADFKFRRTANVTTTVRATGTGFYAAQIDQDTHIEGITIEVSKPMGNGESTYGVRLGGGLGTLYVRYNKMVVGDGTDGASGTNGMPHATQQAPNGLTGQAGAENNSGVGKGAAPPVCDAPGGKGGDGGYNTTAGLTGSTGFGGTPGGAGASANGCTPFVNQPGVQGSPGQTGQSSVQGTPGQGGNTLGGVMGHFYLPANGGNGGNALRGNGGGGGGGGGGGSNAFPCNPDSGGGGGSGGCGGKGGNGGTGGQGGGGSFGAFAVSGKIIVTNNSMQLGSGGNGGIGGNGSQGQTGGIGGNGGSHSDDSGPGGKGGDGGKGGAGGPGGGGGGGPSACLARTASVTFTYDTNTNSCSTGAIGIGANGGTNPDGGQGNVGKNGTQGFNIQLN